MNRTGAGGSPAQSVPSRAPSVPDVMPRLAAMPTEEVTQMLEDEQKYVDFVRREAAQAHIVKVGLGIDPSRLPRSCYQLRIACQATTQLLQPRSSACQI